MTVLQLSGVLGLIDAGRVLAELAGALLTSPRRVVVCDLHGLRAPAGTPILTVFPAALRRAGGWPACSLHLAAPNPELAAELAAMRMRRYLPVHPDVAVAMVAAERDLVLTQREILLPASPDSPRLARRALAEVWPSGDLEARSDALVVASELATNALKHVGEPFGFTVSLTPSMLLVAARDAGPGEPILRPPRSGPERGLGMQVINRLSEVWGVRLAYPRGKIVWAGLRSPGTLTLIPRSRQAPGLDR